MDGQTLLIFVKPLEVTHGLTEKAVKTLTEMVGVQMLTKTQ